MYQQSKIIERIKDAVFVTQEEALIIKGDGMTE
jgi:hypothetical protein